MELLPSLLEVSHTLAWTLIHFLWQGLLIGALYEFGKRRADGSIRKQHNLAMAALLILLLAPVLTFQYLQSGAASVEVAPVAQTMSVPIEIGSGQSTTAGLTRTQTGNWTAALTAIWLFGALLACVALLRDLHRLRRAIATSREPPADLLALLAAQMQRLDIGQPVRLRLTATVHSPGVYGFLRPVILLPIALALSLPRDQLETLIAHELAHVRRADYIGNLLAIAARTFLYFHPAVHRICRDLETARETLCDDMVIGLRLDPLKYARALSKAEEFRQQVPMPLLTATGGLLSLRVRRILDLELQGDGKKQRRGNSAPLLLVAALLLTVLVAGQRLSTIERGTVRPELGLAASLMQQAAPSLLPFESSPLTRPVLAPLSLAAASSAGAESVAAASAAAVETVTVAPISIAATDSVEAIPVEAASIEPLALTGVPDLSVESLTDDFDPVLAATTAPAQATPDDATVNHASADTTQRTAVSDSGERDPIAPANRPEPSRMVTPNYPRDALRTNAEGVVQVQYQIDGNGRPTGIRAIGSEPPLRDFIDAATNAMSRWRFPAGSAEPNQVFVQEFSFRLGDNNSDHQCELPTGTRICRRGAR